jgi:hypothetical protein
MFKEFTALAAAALALPSVAVNAQQPVTVKELDAAKAIFNSGNLRGCVRDLLKNEDSPFPRGLYQHVSCNFALSGETKKGIVFYAVENTEDTKRTPKRSYQLSVNEYFSTRLEAQIPVETEKVRCVSFVMTYWQATTKVRSLLILAIPRVH